MYEITFDDFNGNAKAAYRHKRHYARLLAIKWADHALSRTSATPGQKAKMRECLEIACEATDLRVFFLPEAAGCITIERLLD